MISSLRYLRIGFFGIVIYLVVTTVFNVTMGIDSQEKQNGDDCDPEIAFSKAEYDSLEIYLLTISSLDEIQITNSDSNIYMSAEQPSWSPDGETILFIGQVSEPPGSSSYNLDIFAITADGTEVEQLTQTSSNEMWPVFSPDGSKIAFTTNRDGNWEVYMMNADGSEPVNLTGSEANDGQGGITWSPDGSAIAFTTDRDSGRINQTQYEAEQLYIIDTSDQSLVNLSADVDVCSAGEFYRNLAWSPTDNLLAFALSCSYLSDLYLMDLTQPDRPLINLTLDEEISMTNDGYLGLSWSPDESQIVYVSSPEGQGNYGSELFLIDVNSSNFSEQSKPEQITYNNSLEILIANPAWKPCR